MVEATVEKKGAVSTERRYSISDHLLTPQRCAEAVRGHWDIDNGLHWVLDVLFDVFFKEDPSRLRRRHGARTRAIVRHVALNLVRLGKGKRSIKTLRKVAGWKTDQLARLLNPSPL